VGRGRRGDRLGRRSLAVSFLAHAALLAGLNALPAGDEPIEPLVVPVELVAESGAPGASGGPAGDRAGSGSAAAPAATERAASAERRPVQRAQAPAVRPPPRPRPKPAPPRPPEPLEREEQAEERPVAQASDAQSAPAEGGAPPGEAGASQSGGGGPGGGAEGAGSGSFGDGEGLGDDYLERLRRRLAQFKKYPPEARRLKQEGTVLVAFVLARDGAVLDAQVDRSSGFPLIDQAVLDMVLNASPAPPLPPEFSGERVTIVMPVRFSIGFFGRLF